MPLLERTIRRSGYVSNLKGFGMGFAGGLSELATTNWRPITGINARFHFDAGIEPSPTRDRRVSGNNLIAISDRNRILRQNAESYSSRTMKQIPVAMAINQNIDLMAVRSVNFENFTSGCFRLTSNLIYRPKYHRRLVQCMVRSKNR